MNNMFISDEAQKSLDCLAQIQYSVAVEETGTNSFGGYKYPQLKDMTLAIRPCLQQHGCMVMFNVDNYTVESRHEEVNGKDKLVTYSTCDGTVTLVYSGNPRDRVSVSCFGFKVDVGDRALGSVTIMRRYLLACLFNFITGDDPDEDASDYKAAQHKLEPKAMPKNDVPKVASSEPKMRKARPTTTTSISDFIV